MLLLCFLLPLFFFKSEITKNARKKLVSLTAVIWMSRNVTSKMFLCFSAFVAWKQVSSLEGEVPQQSKWRFPRFAVYCTSLRIFKENLPRDENVSRKTSKNVSWESCCFKIFKSCRTFCCYYHNIFIQG